MTYKLIALDIDGTIRSMDRAISKRTRRIVDQVSNSGAIVTICTGRMFRSALMATDELNITAPIVSFQGAYIADPQSHQELMHRPLTEKMALSALSELSDWNSEILAYQGDRVFFNRPSQWVKEYIERNRGLLQESSQIIEDLSELASVGLTRIAFVGDDLEVENYERHFRQVFGSRLYIARTLPHLCEVLHPDTGKQRGLAWLADYLGVRQIETAAFGNGDEDASMLKWAGLGVAVEGATQTALDNADLIAGPMEEDGVAQVLEELANKGRLGG